MITARPTFALAVLLSVSGASGQEETQPTMEEILARFEQHQPIWNLEWSIDENGDLVWRSKDPIPDDSGEWSAVDVFHGLANIGMMGWINAMLAGPRDLASLTDAERYFSSLGLGTSVGELRKRIVTPVIETDNALARRAELERILAVRLVQERGITEANPELRAIMSSSDVDPFLSRAARDALGTVDAVPPVVIPDAALASLPDADFLFFFDQTRIPPLFWLPRRGIDVTSRLIIGAELFRTGVGNPVNLFPPGYLAAVQVLNELGVLVPFELARLYGNARVDWVLGAFQDAPRQRLWLEAHGRFEVEAVQSSLTAEGVELERGETLRGDGLGPLDLTLELDEERIHVATWQFEGDSPETAGKLRAAGLGEAPIWIHLPGGSMLWQLMGLPVAVGSATLEVETADPVTVIIRTEHETEDLARQMAALLTGVREQGKQLLGEMGSHPEILKALGVLGSVEPTVEANTCVVSADLSGMTVDDVIAVLRRFGLM